MDRREALKRLAAGGAIAAGASVVLSSNAVALTTSGPIIGIPGPGEGLPIVVTPNGNGTITISDGTTASCGDGSTPSISYMWRIQSFSLTGSGRQLVIVGVQSGPSGSTSFSGPPLPWATGPASVTLRKNNPAGNLSNLVSGDSYSIGMMVSWTCGATTTTYTYTIAARVPTIPDAVPA